MARGIKDVNLNVTKNVSYKHDDLFIHKTTFHVSRKFDVKEKCVMCYENDRFLRKALPVAQYPIAPFVTLTIDAIEKMNKLTPTARIILTHIIKKLNINSNYIILDTDELKNILNTKFDSFISKYKKELVDAGFIDRAPGEKVGVYVINHNMFFKGARNEFITKYNETFLMEDDDIDAIHDDINAF